VIARHERKVEKIVGHLKAAATRQLTADGLHPLADFARKDGGTPTPWAENCWKVFLDSRADIVRSVAYVDDHPEQEGKQRQHWSFVLRESR
jgi:hypothetical protein